MSTAKPGCPSDETFTRLVEGLLPEDETRALEAHCDGCLTCARLLAELARSISPSGGAGGGLLGDRVGLPGLDEARGLRMGHRAVVSKKRSAC